MLGLFPIAAEGKPCTEKEGWSAWLTIFDDERNGNVQISHRQGRFPFDNGKFEQFHRLCNNHDVGITIEVLAVSDDSPEGSGIGFVNIKANSMDDSLGLYVISRTVTAYRIKYLEIDKTIIIKQGKGVPVAGACPPGKTCVPSELNFPGPKKEPSRQPNSGSSSGAGGSGIVSQNATQATTNAAAKEQRRQVLETRLETLSEELGNAFENFDPENPDAVFSRIRQITQQMVQLIEADPDADSSTRELAQLLRVLMQTDDIETLTQSLERLTSLIERLAN